MVFYSFFNDNYGKVYTLMFSLNLQFRDLIKHEKNGTDVFDINEMKERNQRKK